MNSYWNKILKVDLSNGTCKAEELSDDVYEKFLGGAGMAAYMLWIMRIFPKQATPGFHIYILLTRSTYEITNQYHHNVTALSVPNIPLLFFIIYLKEKMLSIPAWPACIT